LAGEGGKMSAKSAFPVLYSKTDCDGENPILECYDPGMSLRDYFAGQALAGMLCGICEGPDRLTKIATTSYALADAMLVAKEKAV
jgi:hypothetical protein